jgi:hypothetical protein
MAFTRNFVRVQELARTRVCVDYSARSSGKHKRRLTVLRVKCSVIDKVTSARGLSERQRRGVMRESNGWILAGASVGVMLMVLEAVPAELTSDNDWVQAYGRQDKDCLEWNDTCASCVRAQLGGDYSCSHIGIACQPKEVRCMRRADEKTK